MTAEASTTRAIVWQLHRESSGDVIRVVLPDRASVVLMRNLLQRLADVGESVSVGLQPRMQLRGIMSVTLRCTAEPLSKALSQHDRHYEWTCTRDGWLTNAALLEPFRRGRAGHQYLTDEDADDALIEVSFGEA